MGTQADELVGLASLIAEANGLTRVSHVREKIDEMIHATLLRAGLEAALLVRHLFAQKLVTRKNYDIERARALALKAAGLSGA